MTGPRAAAAALAASLAFAASAEEPVAPATAAKGRVDVTTEKRLVVEGFTGEVRLVDGEDRKLAYRSTSADGQESPVAVALRAEAGVLKLLPTEGATGAPRVLEVSVPPQLAVSLDLADCRVSVEGIRGALDVKGKGIALTGRDLASPVSVDVEGGSVTLAKAGGGVSVAGTALDVHLSGGRDFTLRLDGGTADVRRAIGTFSVDLESVAFTAYQIRSERPMLFRAREGAINLRNARGAIELRLKGTALALAHCTGDVDVETDGAVQFDDLDADLHVDGVGASVRGKKIRGLLEVRTSGAEVVAEGVGGAARIEGNALNILLTNVEDDVVAYTSGSRVAIQDAGGSLDVESELGTILIARARGPVEVVSRKDEVHLDDLSGTLQLDADGQDVWVSWAALPRDGESFVRNEGGGVFVTLPARGAVRVEAQAKFGSVESSIPGIVVDDARNTASGEMGRGGGAALHIVANGDIRLQAAKAGTVPRAEKRRPASPR